MSSSQWPWPQLEPPRPSEDLRRRALMAAEEARRAPSLETPSLEIPSLEIPSLETPSLETVAEDGVGEWTQRLWKSRSLWLVWAAGMVLLVGFNGWLSSTGPTGSPLDASRSFPAALAEKPSDNSPDDPLLNTREPWRQALENRLLTPEPSLEPTEGEGAFPSKEMIRALREVI